MRNMLLLVLLLCAAILATGLLLLGQYVNVLLAHIL